MFTTLTIGNKEVPMESTALTSLAYKKIFGDDILRTLGTFRKLNVTGSEANSAIDGVSQLAFVMAKQADDTITVKDLMRLTEDDYYEWLNTFEYGDLIDSETISQILDVWSGNLATTVDPKNAVDAPVEN